MSSVAASFQAWQGFNQEALVPADKKKALLPVPPFAVIAWRETVRESDVEAVHTLVAEAGVFSTDEVSIAVELVQEKLLRGVESGYHFLFAEHGGRPVGYTCYGPIPGTENRFDLYWIVVHPKHRLSGLGRELLRRTETLVADLGGQRLYAETSTSDRYQAARYFYRSLGFRKVAILPHYYREGDGKAVFEKPIGR
jgi:Acetyltransferases